MLKYFNLLLLVFLAFSAGCGSAQKSGMGSGGGMAEEVDSINMMEEMLMGVAGYDCAVEIFDVDGNGADDLSVDYLSGSKGDDTTAVKINGISKMMSTAAAGAGYDIDKLCIIIDDVQYMADFKVAEKCAWQNTSSLEEEADSKKCLAKHWKTFEN